MWVADILLAWDWFICIVYFLRYFVGFSDLGLAGNGISVALGLGYALNFRNSYFLVYLSVAFRCFLDC